jgi:Ser/Thr protein kinase RdoA (MazF antagonist)
MSHNRLTNEAIDKKAPDSSKPAPRQAAYHALGPEQVLNALEEYGYRCDGRLLALNSFENRVYQVGLDDGSAVVAKFYRPGRWSNEAILEEHIFTFELAEEELPVIAPLHFNGLSILEYGHYRFAIFPNRGGRAPDLEDLDQLEQMGRFLGRIHTIGAISEFEHRPTLDLDTFGRRPRDWLLENKFLPADIEVAYDTLTADLLKDIEHAYDRASPVQLIRLHGDCHPGNILWTDDGPHIVDLDDARMGPPMQDLWMFLSGSRIDMTAGLDAVLSGYTRFCDFDARQLHLVEALRTLRLIHYYAWLARRWDDPAFPIAFPWFNTQRCWEDHVLTLREQAAVLNEAPLTWFG